MNLVPSYLLIAAWTAFTVIAAARRDYFAVVACLTVIVFAVANIVLLRALGQRIAAKDETIGHQRRHIEDQKRNIDVLYRQLATRPHTRTDKKDPHL